MSKPDRVPPDAKGVATLSPFLGPPPLLPGESEVEFAVFTEKIRQAIGLDDPIADLLVQDCAYLSWNIQRLRRYNVSVMSNVTHAGLRNLLVPMLWSSQVGTDEEEIDRLISGWARGTPSVVAIIQKMLTTAGLDNDSVVAETFAARLDEIDKIDRMIASAEKRRNATLAEIERLRETLGRRNRGPIEEINEADYEAAPEPGPEQAG